MTTPPKTPMELSKERSIRPAELEQARKAYGAWLAERRTPFSAHDEAFIAWPAFRDAWMISRQAAERDALERAEYLLIQRGFRTPAAVIRAMLGEGRDLANGL